MKGRGAKISTYEPEKEKGGIIKADDNKRTKKGLKHKDEKEKEVEKPPETKTKGGVKRFRQRSKSQDLPTTNKEGGKSEQGGNKNQDNDKNNKKAPAGNKNKARGKENQDTDSNKRSKDKDADGKDKEIQGRGRNNQRGKVYAKDDIEVGPKAKRTSKNNNDEREHKEIQTDHSALAETHFLENKNRYRSQKFFAKTEKPVVAKTVKPKQRFASVDFDDIPRASQRSRNKSRKQLYRFDSFKSIDSKPSYIRSNFSRDGSHDRDLISTRQSVRSLRDYKSQDESDEDGVRRSRPQSKWTHRGDDETVVRNDDGEIVVRNDNGESVVRNGNDDEVVIQRDNRYYDRSHEHDFEISVGARSRSEIQRFEAVEENLMFKNRHEDVDSPETRSENKGNRRFPTNETPDPPPDQQQNSQNDEMEDKTPSSPELTEFEKARREYAREKQQNDNEDYKSQTPELTEFEKARREYAREKQQNYNEDYKSQTPELTEFEKARREYARERQQKDNEDKNGYSENRKEGRRNNRRHNSTENERHGVPSGNARREAVDQRNGDTGGDRSNRRSSPSPNGRTKSQSRSARRRSHSKNGRRRSVSGDKGSNSRSSDERNSRHSTRRNSPSTDDRKQEQYREGAPENGRPYTSSGQKNRNDTDSGNHDVRFDSATKRHEFERERRQSRGNAELERPGSPYPKDKTEESSPEDRNGARYGNTEDHQNGDLNKDAHNSSQGLDVKPKQTKRRIPVRRFNVSRKRTEKRNHDGDDRREKGDKQKGGPKDDGSRDNVEKNNDFRSNEEQKDESSADSPSAQNGDRSSPGPERRYSRASPVRRNSDKTSEEHREDPPLDGRYSVDSLDGRQRRDADRNEDNNDDKSQDSKYERTEPNRNGDGDDDNEDNTYGYNNYQYGNSETYSRPTKDGEKGEMLEQSAEELQTTVEELEKRFDAIENEGNEWKTRFETQTEMNQQLERQILMLENKVEESKKNLRDVGKSPQGGKLLEDLADANPQMVKALEKDKMSLMNQIRDLEWRLDQESKAYHRANDERKQYVIEINSTKGSIYHLQRQRAAGDATYRTPREQGGNIPDDQRILDPKKGPIRKTAAVKSLPSLDHI